MDQLDKGKLFTFVIPVYNEEAAIGGTLQELDRYCVSHHIDSEVVIVDDGSSDQTVQKINEVKSTFSFMIRIFQHKINLGKGAAVKKGVLSAKGDYIVFFDADLATPLCEIEKLKKEFHSGADIVIGTRKVKDAQILKRQSKIRQWLGVGFTLLSNLMIGTHVTDVTCGFKGFQYQAAQSIFSKQLLERWGFDSEILFLARQQGLEIREIPVFWSDSGETRVRIFRDVIRSFLDLLTIRWNALCGLYRGTAK